LSASFGCPYEGEVPVDRVVEICRRLGEGGAAEVALADSIGVAAPNDVTELITAVRNVLPSTTALRAHFHNTRNTGLANAYAAYEAGIDALDASLGGIGGCPFAPGATGNIPTEDLVYMLERMGVATGVDLDRLAAVVPWIEDVLGKRVPGLFAKAGPFPKSA
jgi:hydroxymethylglutaryl-CoA lyase